MGTNYVGGATVNTTDWGTCRTVGNSAFTAALLYIANGNLAFKQYAISQVKWLAGLSPFSRSWITQYGASFPQNPHSRNDVNLKSVARLTGGVVSGPTASNCTATDKSTCSWTFSDVADNYKNTECALDYGCGAIGAVAFIRWTAKTDTIRIDSGLVATPANMDLAAQSETVYGVLAQPTAWTVIFRGETSKAIKTFTGSTAQVSIQNWKGEKDNGSPDFTVERVTVYFDTTKMKIWGIQRSTIASTYFNVSNIPGKTFGANDIEVDNFEGAVKLTNLLGGKWNGYCDASDSVAGGKSSPPIISSDSGRSSAKGLYFSLTRSAGATIGAGPYAGIRTTFNAAGSSVNLGAADTIMFDIKPLGAGDSIWAQLEQSDITDKAYYGSKLTFGTAGAWVRAYLPLASLTQPSWKTAAKTINVKSAVAVRFVSYGVGSSRFILDNLRISNLKVTPNAVIDRGARKNLHSGNSVDFFKVSPASLTYALYLSGAEGKVINAELFDCLGKKIVSYKVENYTAGKAITVNNCNLRTGIYFLKHTVAGTSKSFIAPFTVSN
jgi:hypothetical protein